MKSFLSGGALIALLMTTGAHAQSAPGDAISPEVVLQVIHNSGAIAADYLDASGNPRVNAQIDRHNWTIILRDCAAGELEQRRCRWFEFVVDFNVAKPVSADLINRWNDNYRFARASLQQGGEVGCPNQDRCTARIVVDVLMSGTGGDPEKTFRTYFEIVKRRATGFRQYIGAPG